MAIRASGNFNFNFNFNLIQRALVLEDYAPALGVGGGFVSRKKGARSMGEEKKEGMYTDPKVVNME